MAFLVSSNLLAETEDQHIKVTLRAVGHEFLLELGDNSSRVLPIEKIDGRYAIKFERQFSFLPGQLVFVIHKVFEKSKINDGYIVEVEQCVTHQLVYSLEININQAAPFPACQERGLPEDCYVFYFTLVDSKRTEFDTNKPDTAKTKIVDAEPIDTASNDIQSSENKVSMLEAAVSIDELENESSPFFIYGFILFILLIVGVVVIYLKRKKKQPKPNPDLLQIGQFQFDQKAMRLLLKAQIIELSGKEADLLFLLFTNENKTLEREYILKMVWGDEGDYVGRTLDVFVSKLRKKLETDAQLKIINIRGVGYKFVIN